MRKKAALFLLSCCMHRICSSDPHISMEIMSFLLSAAHSFKILYLYSDARIY